MRTLSSSHDPRAVAGTVHTVAAVRSCDTGIQGPESLILALAAELTARGLRYVIVNLWDGTPPTVALHEEALRRGLESHIVAGRWDLDPALLPRLAVTLRRIRPDVIHSHDFKSEVGVLATAPLTRAPLVTSFYGRLAINSRAVRAQDWSRLLGFRLFAHVFANSQAQRAELQRWRVPRRKTSVQPSFVDTRQIWPPAEAERLAARARLGLTPGQPVLATIARLSPNKGHRYMIEAMAAISQRMPDVVYLVPGEGGLAWRGDGGLRGDLERQAAALGVAAHVRFLGYYPDLRTILHAADILVSPSLLEGMQVSLLEAMAAGLPVVATAVGGTPDAVLDGVTGCLIPPADPAALASATLALLADRERMARFGAAARRRAEAHFDVRVVTDQMLAVYAAAAGRPGREGQVAA
ncbi:MAG: glycosyltransferase family 4 protein [Chloroflexales bacterium]|nr:glycosyltransferase family 4 protein [Chloroflexales bacterium]